jgi:hypothetical protein
MARLTLEFSEDVDALLRDLAKAEKFDKYEVIRRALALCQYVRRRPSKKKHKLKITDDHQGIRVPVGHRHGPAAGRPCRRPRRTDSPRSQGLDGVQIPLIVCGAQRRPPY